MICKDCGGSGNIGTGPNRLLCQRCRGAGSMTDDHGTGDAAPCVQHVPAGFVTRDSGKQDEFKSGAVRDAQDGKPRYDLIPVSALRRLADLYMRGADKYGEWNWQRGIPFRRVVASLLRHAFAYLEGDNVEDHLAAVAWNAFTLMAYEHMITTGKLPPELDDIA